MTRVTFSPRATREVDKIYAYIARGNSAAAEGVVHRIYEVAEYLARFPDAGRKTVLRDISAYAVTPHPYLLFYKHLPKTNEIRIVRVQHGARRDRPAFQEEAQEFRPAPTF